MISHQMLLIPRICLHPLIVLKTPKHRLAKAVKISHICELRIVELGHECASGGGVVYLESSFISKNVTLVLLMPRAASDVGGAVVRLGMFAWHRKSEHGGEGECSDKGRRNSPLSTV